MTSKLTVKRSLTTSSKSHKVDLVVSNWLRNNMVTSKSSKNKEEWLISLDLISLIAKYQIYICMFDIYNPERFTIINNKTETLIKTTHDELSPQTIQLPPSTIISSVPFVNGNSVHIKILRRLTDSYNSGFVLSLGFVGKIYFKWIAYETEISEQYYGFRYYISISNGMISLKHGKHRENIVYRWVKLNDIISMKFQNDVFEWQLNGDILFKKHVTYTNLYFAISYNCWSNVKLLSVK